VRIDDGIDGLPRLAGTRSHPPHQPQLERDSSN